MSWKKKYWDGRPLYSENFAEAIESEFDDFKTLGDVTLNDLEERCKEIVTVLANWVDELEEQLDEKDEKIGELENQLDEL